VGNARRGLLLDTNDAQLRGEYFKLLGFHKELMPSREALRAALGITGSLLGDARSMRNNFDHIDKELEKWSEGIGDRPYFDKNITFNACISIDGATPKQLRTLDLHLRTVTFLDQRVSLEATAATISEIRDKAEDAIFEKDHEGYTQEDKDAIKIARKNERTR
jgi:hypothetical protein